MQEAPAGQGMLLLTARRRWRGSDRLISALSAGWPGLILMRAGHKPPAACQQSCGGCHTPPGIARPHGPPEPPQLYIRPACVFLPFYLHGPAPQPSRPSTSLGSQSRVDISETVHRSNRWARQILRPRNHACPGEEPVGRRRDCHLNRWRGHRSRQTPGQW